MHKILSKIQLFSRSTAFVVLFFVSNTVLCNDANSLDTTRASEIFYGMIASAKEYVFGPDSFLGSFTVLDTNKSAKDPVKTDDRGQEQEREKSRFSGLGSTQLPLEKVKEKSLDNSWKNTLNKVKGWFGQNKSDEQVAAEKAAKQAAAAEQAAEAKRAAAQKAADEQNAAAEKAAEAQRAAAQKAADEQKAKQAAAEKAAEAKRAAAQKAADEQNAAAEQAAAAQRAADEQTAKQAAAAEQAAEAQRLADEQNAAAEQAAAAQRAADEQTAKQAAAVEQAAAAERAADEQAARSEVEQEEAAQREEIAAALKQAAKQVEVEQTVYEKTADDVELLISGAIKEDTSKQNKSLLEDEQDAIVTSTENSIMSWFYVGGGVVAASLIAYKAYTYLQKRMMTPQKLVAVIIASTDVAVLQKAYVNIIEVAQVKIVARQKPVLTTQQIDKVMSLIQEMNSAPYRQMMIAVMLHKFEMKAADKRQLLKNIKDADLI